MAKKDNKSKSKKQKVAVSYYDKKERPKKETIMVLKSKSVIIDGKVEGKEVLSEKRYYGKDYLVLKNI